MLPPEISSARNQKAHWLRQAFLAVLQYQAAPTIVECGAMRFPWEQPSDGASTAHFHQWLGDAGAGHLFSVDIDPAICEANKERFGAVTSHIVQADGTAFLASFKGTIDLLYLDSLAAETWGQLRAALPKLAAEAVVVIDDTHDHDGHAFGKAYESLPHLRKGGWTVYEVGTEEGYRMALARRQPWPLV